MSAPLLHIPLLGFLEVHAAHAAHAAAGHRRHRGLVVRNLGDRRFGRDEQARHRRRILQRRANHLGRIDHA